MVLLDAATFFGRMHPLVVHFPVGFLLLGCIFYFVSQFDKYKYLGNAVPVILLLGFISAVAACVFGYLLSLTGDYDPSTLKNHRAAGLVLAVLSGIVYGLSLRIKARLQRNIFSFSLLATIILLIFTGHQGAALTHGNDYLSLQVLSHQKRTKPAAFDQTYIFEDVVHPILTSRCGQCHNDNKRKGRLSIETLKDILKGGKSGPAVVAGKLTESELYKRVTLDPSDEHYMPTDGKTPLKKGELEIIKWWIEQGGAVENKKLVAMANHQKIEQAVSAYMRWETEGAAEGDEVAQQINPAIPMLKDTSAIQHLRQNGFVVRWMYKRPAMLDVSLKSDSPVVIRNVEQQLKAIASNIIWLNLSDNKLKDGDLTFLKQLHNLEKLRLDKNPVTNEICRQLTGLSHLQAVNVNETAVTEAGIEILRKNKAIQRIYHWSPLVQK